MSHTELATVPSWTCYQMSIVIYFAHKCIKNLIEFFLEPFRQKKTEQVLLALVFRFYLRGEHKSFRYLHVRLFQI